MSSTGAVVNGSEQAGAGLECRRDVDEGANVGWIATEASNLKKGVGLVHMAHRTRTYLGEHAPRDIGKPCGSGPSTSSGCGRWGGSCRRGRRSRCAGLAS